jgi:phosphotransferase system enzyme I (PtsI)
MEKRLLVTGVGNNNGVVSGEVAEWTHGLLEYPDLISGKIVYSRGDSPLYRMAILADNGARGVLLEEGGKNYHPLILLGDAGTPAIAGVGELDLLGEVITLDSVSGSIYSGTTGETKTHVVERGREAPSAAAEVYVNVGYPAAIEAAAYTGADGIGLFRTEFCAARTLSRVLGEKVSPTSTVRELIEQTNEADAVYAMAKDERLADFLVADLRDAILTAGRYFPGSDITVRTLDMARGENDPLGNRGIRRCVAEGGHTLRVVAQAVKEAMATEKGAYLNIVLILPLVSHYSQISTSLDVFLDSGLCLRRLGNQNRGSVKFGWEIEQPAASQNNRIWLEAFEEQYGRPPDVIGIGTNDLTQFTIALGRDVYSQEEKEKPRAYLRSLYDEKDSSVVRQVYEVAAHCRDKGVKLFLLGEAAADPTYIGLLMSFGIIPSVSISKVQVVKNMISARLKEATEPETAVVTYIDSVCGQYPAKARRLVREQLFRTFGIPI